MWKTGKYSNSPICRIFFNIFLHKHTHTHTHTHLSCYTYLQIVNLCFGYKFTLPSLQAGWKAEVKLFKKDTQVKRKVSGKSHEVISYLLLPQQTTTGKNFLFPYSNGVPLLNAICLKYSYVGLLQKRCLIDKGRKLNSTLKNEFISKCTHLSTFSPHLHDVSRKKLAFFLFLFST
jgi:hypothetical protein